MSFKCSILCQDTPSSLRKFIHLEHVTTVVVAIVFAGARGRGGILLKEKRPNRLEYVFGTVPVQCPYSARTVPVTVPVENSHSARGFLILKRITGSNEFPLSRGTTGTVEILYGHCYGHCTGTARALYGHCAKHVF